MHVKRDVQFTGDKQSATDDKKTALTGFFFFFNMLHMLVLGHIKQNKTVLQMM